MEDKTQYFEDYFKEVSREYKGRRTTELTFRTYLQTLLSNLSDNVEVSHENSGTRDTGRPDFICFRKRSHIPIGFVETKDIGTNLNKELQSDQIKKYYNTIPNIVLTDYCRFVLYREDKVIDLVLFSEEELNKTKKTFDKEIINKFLQIFDIFIDFNLPTIKNVPFLAKELAKRASVLRDLTLEQLTQDLKTVEEGKPASSVYGFYLAFRELIKEASPLECVDAYAQSITYGLFLSKVSNPDENLNRDTAFIHIPATIKIIKKIFKNITGDELPRNLTVVVNILIELLNNSDMNAIMSGFTFDSIKTYKDPFIYFYEDFLKEYNPQEKTRLGVFYTPEPVVLCITRSLHYLIKSTFNRQKGFAESGVTVLDFATGTGTFLANMFLLALDEIRGSGQAGIEKDKIKEHLLKNFYGFEILVAPYIIAHLKLTRLLKQNNYTLSDDERVQVYLTNTLDPNETAGGYKGFATELTEETREANVIKRDMPILVITGNPPYAQKSYNNSNFIKKLLKDYKVGVVETQKGALENDYIKFIRFAQFKIEQNSEGIIGVITSNSYLDGSAHRQMRKTLMDVFDKIYIINLHGDLRDKEDIEEKDKNVFDIKEGVAISFYVKLNKKVEKKVFYADLFGDREQKYEFLRNNTLQDIKFKELVPKPKYYEFIPVNTELKEEYENFFEITQIFKEWSSGVVSGKDDALIKYTSKEVEQVSSDLFNPNKDLAYLEKEYGIKNTTGWNIKLKKSKLLNKEIRKYSTKNIMSIAYRPFDYRFVYYSDFLQRPQKRVMQHLIKKKNIALACVRTIGNQKFKHVGIANTLIDKDYISNHTYAFPLYLIDENDTNKLQVNFTSHFFKFVSDTYPNKKVKPEEILNYIYAILHSNNYRKRYKEELKRDFPRIPFIKDYNKFTRLSKLGGELINLHLMNTNFKKNIATFEVSGSNEVETVKYIDDKIYINANQYFGGIRKEIQDFEIGNYKVLDKWLKSRKNKKLTLEEIETFINIVNILNETIKIMKEIDDVYTQEDI